MRLRIIFTTFLLFFLLSSLELIGFSWLENTEEYSKLENYDLPRIAQFTITPPLCSGQRGTIYIDSVAGGKEPFEFNIDNTGYTTNPSTSNLLSGDHTLLVRDANGGVSDTIFFMPEPEPFTVKLKASARTIKSGMPLLLEAIVSPTNSSIIGEPHWRPQQLFENNNVGNLIQALTLEETANFFVKVTNSNGCEASDHLTVEVDARVVFAPNAMTPNENHNAYFTLYSAGAVQRIVSLQIFNRWGLEVFAKENFEPNDPMQGWDGHVHGARAPSGVYIYAAVVEYIDGTKERINGDLTVIVAN